LTVITARLSRGPNHEWGPIRERELGDTQFYDRGLDPGRVGQLCSFQGPAEGAPRAYWPLRVRAHRRAPRRAAGPRPVSQNSAACVVRDRTSARMPSAALPRTHSFDQVRSTC